MKIGDGIISFFGGVFLDKTLTDHRISNLLQSPTVILI